MKNTVTMENYKATLYDILFVVRTNPKQDSNQCLWTIVEAVISTSGNSKIPGKERQPTYQKRSHNNAKRNECFVFLSPRGMDPMTFTQPCTG